MILKAGCTSVPKVSRFKKLLSDGRNIFNDMCRRNIPDIVLVTVSINTTGEDIRASWSHLKVFCLPSWKEAWSAPRRCPLLQKGLGSLKSCLESGRRCIQISRAMGKSTATVSRRGDAGHLRIREQTGWAGMESPCWEEELKVIRLVGQCAGARSGKP